MKIAFCASEAVPYAKTGGLADVCGALPLALSRLEHEVILILPKYYMISAHTNLLRSFDRDFDWTQMDGVKVYFLKNDMYLRAGLYGDRSGDYVDNLRRFSYFCRMSCELFGRTGFYPDIVHCHDWQTSLIPALIKADRGSYFGANAKRPKTLLTLHNVSYQGIFSKEQMPETGLPWDYFSYNGFEFHDQINLLKGGIQFADVINTVSPTYAEEVQSPLFGCGLEGVLSSRKENFCGIVNGVDYNVWNPSGDRNLFKTYSQDDLEGKKINKLTLQKMCSLSCDVRIPLFGFVGRLVEQKGVDILIKILPQLCRQGSQVIILGAGEAKFEESLLSLIKEFPRHIFFSSQFDDKLAHRIYGACDFFLMPSKFEPCGIGQLISFKYGTVPVIFKTGGLADTVIDYTQDKCNGNGFVFSKYSDQEFLAAIKRGLKLFHDEKNWLEVCKRLMCLNFSWKESAKKYAGLYERELMDKGLC